MRVSFLFLINTLVAQKNPIYWVFFSENSLQAELSFLLHSLLTSTGNGSKLTVLNMRGGYLATESSRDTSRVVRAHLTTAELLKKNARDTAGPSHSQQTYHGTCVLNSAVPGGGRRFYQSEFQPSIELGAYPSKLKISKLWSSPFWQ